MDFLTGKIKPMYFKYLTAAFGSADFVHLWRGGYGCGGTISGTGRNGSFGRLSVPFGILFYRSDCTAMRF